MHLASINSAEEQKDLQDHIQAYGMGHEHFWTSGTDQGEEGKFFWMGTGKPITYQNWNAGEPNNFQYVFYHEKICRACKGNDFYFADMRMESKSIAWKCGIEMAKALGGMTLLAVSQPFSSARPDL